MRVMRAVSPATAMCVATGLHGQTRGQPGNDTGGKAAKNLAAAGKFPPALPGGNAVVTDTSDEFLKPPATLREGVGVAKAPPTIDFLYFPGQTYPGRPWSTRARE